MNILLKIIAITLLVQFIAIDKSSAQEANVVSRNLLVAEALNDKIKDFDEQVFESEKNVRYLLQSDGIIPNKLNWSQIAMMCSNLKVFDKKMQNRCKYSKAKLMNSYNHEKIFCKNFVEKSYSFNRLSQNQAKNYVMLDETGSRSNITLIETGRTMGAIRDIQDAKILACMKDQGWVNPDDWKAGKNN